MQYMYIFAIFVICTAMYTHECVVEKYFSSENTDATVP